MFRCLFVFEKGCGFVWWGDGEDIGGVGGEGTTIRIYFMKNRSILNLKSPNQLQIN